MKSTSFNEAISHTADGVAYRRTFTDIPYSQQTFGILEEIEGPLDPKEKARADSMPWIIPYFEARYLMTDWFLAESCISQILELASGLSPRGLYWAQDPRLEYVEIDLPDKMALKRRIVEQLRIRNNLRAYRNLHLLDGNVTECSSILELKGMFNYEPREPIFFICEGLLRYMDWNDKAKLCRGIFNLMNNNGRGSMWITPDIELLSDANATPESRARYDMMAKEWGFDVRPNIFRDMDHAVDFFRRLGFNVAKYCHVEMLDQLVSPLRLNLPEEKVRQDLAKRWSFVMTL